MKIQIKKKEIIDEMSSMGGGAVQGHAKNEIEEVYSEKQRKYMCAMMDKPADDRPEGLSKKEAEEMCKDTDHSKKIEEKYSTSGAMMGSGSGQGPYERSPEGHERYVRMRHDMQGLKNFKQNRYFTEDQQVKPKRKIKIRKKLGERCQKGYKTHEKRKTKKMFGKTYRNCVKAEGKSLNEMTNKQNVQQVMSKYDIDVGKELGRGQYGQVFAGISDEHGPVAIKAVKRSGGSMNEVPNYLAVNAARSKSSYIAKHFPQVYFVDEKSDRNYKYIVMEILEVQQGYQEELINVLFGGLNTVLKPFEDEKEVSGTFRSRANRMYVLFKNEESRNSIYQDFYNALTPDLDFLLPVVKEFFAFLDPYVSNIKDNKESMMSLSFMMLSPKAEEYLYNFADGTLKTIYKDAPWLLTFIVKQLEAIQKQDTSGTLFAQYHESIIRYWLEFYRKASPIGMKDEDPKAYATDDKGLDKEKWQAFTEAASVKQAIKDLRQIAGIQAKDMHDGNVMIRPQTGDIVIVDLGLFKKI